MTVFTHEIFPWPFLSSESESVIWNKCKKKCLSIGLFKIWSWTQLFHILTSRYSFFDVCEMQKKITGFELKMQNLQHVLICRVFFYCTVNSLCPNKEKCKKKKWFYN